MIKVKLNLDDNTVREMNDIAKETGFPISSQIELRLKGYSLRRINK